MQQELQALLLDVDGTLADTEEVHRRAFNSAFAEAGLDWNWSRDLYHQLLAVTGGKERIRYFLDAFHAARPVAGISDEYIAQLHARKTVFYTAALAAGEVPLSPGVERLIHEARHAGLRLAIVTTTTEANVTALLEHSFTADVAQWFDVIAAGNVVAKKKPAADIYEYALDKLGLAADQCLAIEDSANGLQSALAAGVDTLITINHFTRDQDFTGAAQVVDHLGEPGQPCHAIAGALPPDSLVDVAYLQRLHADCLQRRGAQAGG